MMVQRVACVLLLLALSSLIQCQKKVVRGASPENAQQYNPSQDYVCAGTGEKIAFSRVNDNFCDCEAEGDDEPGTSACSKGNFFCPNRGHQAKSISSAFVNDGICDCCDGSDEYSDSTKCPNTCIEFAATSKQKREEEIRTHEEGIEIKQRNIQESHAVVQGKRSEVQRLSTELDTKKAALKEVEERKNRAEESERVIKEAKEAARREREAQQQQEQELKRQEEEKSATEQGQQAEVPPQQEENKDNKEGEHVQEGQEGQEGEEGEEEEEEEETEEQQQQPTPPPTPEEPKSPEELAADEARVEYERANSAVRDIERKIEEINGEINQDAGRNHEYRHLIGRCFSGQFSQYSYEVCPFDRTSQSGTSLGTFDKWERDNVQQFSNGQGCWGGPDRSNKVIFTCGTEDKILSVSEPSKCVYETFFSSPAACDENRVSELRQIQLQEERLLHEDHDMVFI